MALFLLKNNEIKIKNVVQKLDSIIEDRYRNWTPLLKTGTETGLHYLQNTTEKGIESKNCTCYGK